MNIVCGIANETPEHIRDECVKVERARVEMRTNGLTWAGLSLRKEGKMDKDAGIFMGNNGNYNRRGMK